MSSLREIQRPKTYRKVSWVKDIIFIIQGHYFHRSSSITLHHLSTLFLFKHILPHQLKLQGQKDFEFLNLNPVIIYLAKCNSCKKKSF